jgi:hypothetical protein
VLAEPFEACLPVLRLFREIGVDCYVGGSFASSFHGTPRSTNDVDMVAELKLAHIPLLVAQLQERFYVDASQAIDAVRRRASFNILYLRTMFKVDIFVSGDGPLDRAAMRRRQRIFLGEPPEPVDIASAEDSVLRKLLWYRLGNEVSERQLKDVLGVLKIQKANLDLEYLDSMAKRLEIQDLWRRAAEAAGLESGFEQSE